MGRSVPEVDNFRALPTPSSAIWPQFLLDIAYRGALVAERSLDLIITHFACDSEPSITVPLPQNAAKANAPLNGPACRGLIKENGSLRCLVAGDAWVMVETKVDLRFSTAWSQFDEAIGHFGGETAAVAAEPAMITDDEHEDVSDDGAQMQASEGCLAA